MKTLHRHTSQSFHLNPICGLAYIPKTTRFLVSYYRPQTKLRKGNVFTCVCLSTEGEHIPPGPYPPGTVPPSPPGSYPLETIPPGLYPQDRTHQLLTSSGSHHTYGRQGGDTHPTGMHSCLSVCFQSCSRKDKDGESVRTSRGFGNKFLHCVYDTCSPDCAHLEVTKPDGSHNEGMVARQMQQIEKQQGHLPR